jgi:hypothetical protein
VFTAVSKNVCCAPSVVVEVSANVSTDVWKYVNMSVEKDVTCVNPALPNPSVHDSPGSNNPYGTPKQNTPSVVT